MPQKAAVHPAQAALHQAAAKSDGADSIGADPSSRGIGRAYKRIDVHLVHLREFDIWCCFAANSGARGVSEALCIKEPNKVEGEA